MSMVVQLTSKAVLIDKLAEPNKLFLKRYREDAKLIGYKIWNKR